MCTSMALDASVHGETPAPVTATDAVPVTMDRNFHRRRREVGEDLPLLLLSEIELPQEPFNLQTIGLPRNTILNLADGLARKASPPTKEARRQTEQLHLDRYLFTNFLGFLCVHEPPNSTTQCCGLRDI